LELTRNAKAVCNAPFLEFVLGCRGDFAEELY
jgi:hypothetical protein